MLRTTALEDSLILLQDIISMKQEITREADYQDGDDCAKKFLCELSGPFRTGLEWHESLLVNVYNQPVLDYSSDSLFFNIAVKVKLRCRISEL